MATVFTHAFVAGGLSSLQPRQAHRVRLAILLATLAVLPDLDVLAFGFGIPYDHPLGHRGFTHSLSFAALAGGAGAALFFGRLGPGSAGWWRVAGLLALGTASHGVLDAFTDAGLGVGFLIPFSNDRFFFPWRPLATSPLRIQAFFNGPALAILANEVLWVWLPVSVALLLRRLAHRSAPSPDAFR